MVEFIDGFATSSGDVLAYFYDQGTGEYIGSGFVHVSQGCGLAPGRALAPPPGVISGYTAQWVDGNWASVEDHRGTVYRTADGEPVEHSQLGTLPEGLTLLPKPTPAHRWEAGAWVFDDALQAAYSAALVTTLARDIDTAAEAARRTLLGDPLQVLEYGGAAADAQAFREAGYPEQAVPRAVSAWVTAQRSAQQAADEILAASARCSEVLHYIRATRLMAKAHIRELIEKNRPDKARQVAETVITSLQELSA